MEIGLNKTSISCYKRVYCGNISREESMEMVVPDVMPDIGEIISSNGLVFLRSKELAAGKLALSGTISTTVLYHPDGEAASCKLNLELPYAIHMEIAVINEHCLASASVRLTYIEARALNPRKIMVRAGLCAHASCYLADKIAFGTEIDAEIDIDTHMKPSTVSADIVSGVWEKTFVLTDEYPLSGAKAAAAELIHQNIELTPDDVKFVGTKMVFKGLVKADLLWRGEDDNLYASAFSSSFSQILELGVQADTSNTLLELMLTGAYFDFTPTSGDNRTVSAELHILAQATCVEPREIVYISDAYSNTHMLDQNYGPAENLCAETPVVLRDNMRGVIETPIAVREILQVMADVGVWNTTESGYCCPINVKILFRNEEGVTCGLVRSFTAKWELDYKEAVDVDLLSVRCTELFATLTAGGIEVRLLAEAQALERRNMTVLPVESLTADEDSPIDLSILPSVVVLPEKQDDLWSLAKKYHSTLDLIQAANADVSSNILLIPRAR